METRIADRHGDVEGSSVERDVENQSKLPLDQRIFFFFFFWVLVYCAEAGRAYVTHYTTERRGAKGERDRKLKYANQCRSGRVPILSA